jgi:hypothetical protein
MNGRVGKLKKGNKVVVMDSMDGEQWGVTVGDVGYVAEDLAWNPYVRFDHITHRIAFDEEHLRLVTGEETELEKLLFWNRVSK